MPFDFCEPQKNTPDDDETGHIYVSSFGDICVETRHSRQWFSPQEFVKLLRSLAAPSKRAGFLPVVQARQTPSFCRRSSSTDKRNFKILRSCKK